MVTLPSTGLVTTGAAGALVSIMKDSVVAGEVFAAASVAVTLTAREPGFRMVAEVHDHAPKLSAVAEQ